MKKNKITIYLQLLVTIAILVVGVMTFINRSYLLTLEVTFAADLLLMAYNNNYFYKRQGVTKYYLICAIALLVLALITFLGVM